MPLRHDLIHGLGIDRRAGLVGVYECGDGCGRVCFRSGGNAYRFGIALRGDGVAAAGHRFEHRFIDRLARHIEDQKCGGIERGETLHGDGAVERDALLQT